MHSVSRPDVCDDLCVVIPASLHGTDLPRRPLRSLAGRPVLLRVLDTAAQVVASRGQIVILADDDEVALLAERQGIRVRPLPGDGSDAELAQAVHDAVSDRERETGQQFTTVLVLRASSPLLRPMDLRDAVGRLAQHACDSVRSGCIDGRASRRAAAATGAAIPADMRAAKIEAPDYRESNSFVVSRREVIDGGRLVGDAVEVLALPIERGLEIVTAHDWWVCERLLRRRRVVFVVIGYPAVGLGHVYRAGLLAHELMDHEVHIVCPRDNDLAASSLAAESLRVHVQGQEDLLETVLALAPDLVINDILNTDVCYVEQLKTAGARVVNFEDLGPGAAAADLVINDIFMEPGAAVNHLNGPDYFCIRDEFLHAAPLPPRPEVREVLVTFGGTDAMDTTERIARLILPFTRRRGIHVSFVTGSGYAHLDGLRRLLAGVATEHAELSNGTKRMSEHMARADLAFSSAGRTVFELAAMRVPAIIIAANEREETHTFASGENGFVYLGRCDQVADSQILTILERLIDVPGDRLALQARMGKWDFRGGRARVLAALGPLLMTERT